MAAPTDTSSGTTTPVVGRSPLRMRTFRYIWLGLAISLLGDQLYRVALTIGVAERGAGALALLGVALALPTAVVGLLSGTLVDGVDKLRLMLVTDMIRAGIVALLAVAFLAEPLSVPLVLGLAASLAVVSVAFTPAVQALIPELGPDRDQIIAMDAWLLGCVTTAAVVGPALAGGLLNVVGPATLMWLNALTFLWSAVLIVLAGRDRARHTEGLANRATKARPSRADAAAGLRFIFGHPVLRPCFTTFPIMELAMYAVPLMLPLAIEDRSSRSAAVWYGTCLAALGAGRVLGLILINRTRLKTHRGAVLRLNFLVQGAALLVVAVTSSPLCYAAALSLMGVASGASQVAMSSYVQLEVPAHTRGRVFAAIISTVSWLQPLGAVIFGLIAASYGADAAFSAMGCVLLAGGLRLIVSRPLATVR